MSYSDDELALLAYVPQVIGSAVASAASSGLFGTGKELFASSTSILDGVKSYPNNALIRQIVPDPAGDRSKAIEQMKRVRDWSMARLKEKGVDSSEKLRTQALADARAAAQLVSEKSSAAEAAEYKQWALSVAEKVAAAATEGGFLGFGGERVSAAERQIIDELRAALGLAAA
jgi:hypothetical protein